jgi:hypothetical protein
MTNRVPPGTKEVRHGTPKVVPSLEGTSVPVVIEPSVETLGYSQRTIYVHPTQNSQVCDAFLLATPVPRGENQSLRRELSS